MTKLVKPLLEYNKSNLRIISKLILKNLTPDLLPKKYIAQNKLNSVYGHCHNASGCLYKIFRSQNMHLYRTKDFKVKTEDFWHWWIVDRNNKIIDLTWSQYSKTYANSLYKKGIKSSLLGFNYKKEWIYFLKE